MSEPNKFMVVTTSTLDGVGGYLPDRIKIMGASFPIQCRLGLQREDALNLALWLVAYADEGGRFESLLRQLRFRSGGDDGQ